MVNKKSGFFGKIIFIVIILLAILFLLSEIGKAETATDIINVTIIINSTDIRLNISNSIYNFNNSNASVYIQQNFSVFYNTNVSLNATISCSNSSVSVTCSCPNVCPSVSYNCNVTEVALNNDTKNLFFNHYKAELANELKLKIDESSGKISTDLAFQLAPTRAEIEGLKSAAFNASLKEQEAYRQRDKEYETNIRLGEIVSSRGTENTLLVIVIIVMSAVFVMFIVYMNEGFDFLDKFRNRGGGNY